MKEYNIVEEFLKGNLEIVSCRRCGKKILTPSEPLPTVLEDYSFMKGICLGCITDEDTKNLRNALNKMENHE